MAVIGDVLGRLARLPTLLHILAEPSILVQALKARYYLRGSSVLPITVRVVGSARTEIHGDGALSFGEFCTVRGTLLPSEFVVHRGARIEIGAKTFINYGVSIAARSRVAIGENCHIGPFVTIADNDEHAIEDRYTVPPSAPVVIEDGVWIGTKATVLKGVRIGQHAVVGAGSVVTRDVPPRTIVAGVPASVVRTF